MLTSGGVELRLYVLFWLTSEPIYIYIYLYMLFFSKTFFFHFFFQKKTPGVSPFRWVTRNQGEEALAFDFADIRRVETQQFQF